jgi:dTDP-4-amino-4,6-dideoxygalactose transaminase
MIKVPFYKPSLDHLEIDEVVATLKGGWLTTGMKTKQFEKDFGIYVQQEHSIALNSCTAALHLALEALHIKEGDGVLVPTMTFAATAEVVRYLGANPILVDCRESDFNLDVADAERRLKAALDRGQRVRAIMPVHYAGQVGDVDGIRRLAQQYDLKVIEDAAHCCPAFYRDGTSTAQDWNPEVPTDSARLIADGWKPVGTSADISCFSFYANKCITTGEGGMACTGNAEWADRMRIMSLHGISRDAWKRFMAEGNWYYEIIAPGYKYNLTDVASAIGVHQLRKSDAFHTRRSQIAGMYRQRLGSVAELTLPTVQPSRVHSWHLYVVRLDLDRLNVNRTEFLAELTKLGLGTSVHYTPLHMHPYYRETYGYQHSDLPCMERVYREIFTLPLFPGLTDDEVEWICETVKTLVAKHLKKS